MFNFFRAAFAFRQDVLAGNDVCRHNQPFPVCVEMRIVHRTGPSIRGGGLRRTRRASILIGV